MKDFKDSYEQRRWQFAADSHARAVEAMKVYAAIADADLRHWKAGRAYWQETINRTETEYPQLRKA